MAHTARVTDLTAMHGHTKNCYRFLQNNLLYVRIMSIFEVINKLVTLLPSFNLYLVKLRNDTNVDWFQSNED